MPGFHNEDLWFGSLHEPIEPLFKAHCTSAKRHAAMTWAQCLKRVFNIDITTCETCGGAVKVIASIEDQGQENK